MSEIAKGMLVQHVSLGVGKVVAVEPAAVHVFFPGAEKRFAAKLRWPGAQSFLRTEGIERDSWLEGLSSFTLDASEGRYALSSTWMTHDQAVARFLGEYPQGFVDPSYLGPSRSARAPRWRAAGAAWAAAMGEGEAARLLADGEVRELVKRTLQLEKHLAAVPGTFQEGTLAQALGDPDAALPFFAALLEVLAGQPGRARTEKLFAAAAALDVDPALAWPIATVLPFVADPGRHALLWPQITCAAAEKLGRDLRYDPLPNWTTYAALRAFSTQLLERLEPSGARDFVDVEAFLHATAAARGAGAAPRRGAPGRAARTPAPSRRKR